MPLPIPLRNAVVLSAAAAAFVSIHCAAQTPPDPGSPQELSRLVSWQAAFETARGIYYADFESPVETLIIPHGRFPRWSPDGRSLAYIDGSRVMTYEVSSGTQRQAAAAQKPRAVAFRSLQEGLLFLDGNQIKMVSPDGSVSTVASGQDYREIDASASGSVLVTTVKSLLGYSILGYDTATGRSWKISSGCSASLSPDASLVTNNASDHRRLFLRDTMTGEKKKVVLAPPGFSFDNQFWSNNSDWVASTAENGSAKVVLAHHIPTGRSFRLNSPGDGDRPDLFIRDAKAAVVQEKP